MKNQLTLVSFFVFFFTLSLAAADQFMVKSIDCEKAGSELLCRCTVQGGEAPFRVHAKEKLDMSYKMEGSEIIQIKIDCNKVTWLVFEDAKSNSVFIKTDSYCK